MEQIARKFSKRHMARVPLGGKAARARAGPRAAPREAARMFYVKHSEKAGILFLTQDNKRRKV
ncbi:UNVERIFIED_ORG: hypothetical protein QOE_1505 [Clostridioides difficile F501]